MVHSRAMSAGSGVPAVFRARFVGLEEQRASSDGSTFYRCFGCGPGHPAGLHVRCFKTADGVLAPVLIPDRYQGPPGAAHGGIVAAFLDEILGAAVVRATGRVSVTGELSVRYVKPVPVDTPMLGRGRLIADHGRYADVEGDLQRLEGGVVVATARGRFFPVSRAGVS